MTLADPLPDSLLSQTRALLRTRGLRPCRRRGQNFLVDPRVRDRIVAAAGIGPGSLVVEVGPGTGILTEAMLRAGASIVAVELDRELAQALTDRLGRDPALVVRVADALRFDFSEALRGDSRQGRIRVVANIPYYITTPLILRFLRHRELFDALFLTVQREVAERLTAAPAGDHAQHVVHVGEVGVARHRLEQGPLRLGIRPRAECRRTPLNEQPCFRGHRVDLPSFPSALARPVFN